MDDIQPLAARDRALWEALPGLLSLIVDITERLLPGSPPCPTSPA